MSGSTRILVIPLKKLILALCVIIAFIIIAAIYILSDKEPESHPTNAAGQNNSINTSVTYSPGVYTSSLMLNGNPVDIQVTVDSDNINSIELVNMSESVQTMYPMLAPSFDEIKNAVIQRGTTADITYDSSNKYTANLLLGAIQNALDKAAAVLTIKKRMYQPAFIPAIHTLFIILLFKIRYLIAIAYIDKSSIASFLKL